MLNDFHFLRPLWFLAAIPLGLLIWRQVRNRLRSGNWQAVCDAHLLPHILIDKETSHRSGRSVTMLALAGLLAILALAGPTWERLPQPVFRKDSALVILLDLSRSMNAADLAPSRLERARFKVADILKRRQEGQTALVVFAGAPFTVSPLTDDTATIEAMLGSLQTSIMPAQGSRVDKALEKAAALLSQAGIQGGEVLLITDGAAPQGCREAIDQLRQGEHRLSILGIGTEEGAPIPSPGGGFFKDRAGSIVVPKLEESPLKDLARLGGGHYQRWSIDERDIDSLLSATEKLPGAKEIESTSLTSERWREQGPWLLLPLVPLAALAFRRGVLTIVLLGVLALPAPARALDWDQLWSRADQKGARAFAEGDMELAAQDFDDPQWKAAAHYRSGDYRQAAEALQDVPSGDAHYNRGNALARQGQFQDALTAYEAALKIDPGNEDARFNRGLIREQLKKEQQQQSSQQGDGQDSETQQDDENRQQDNTSDQKSSTDSNDQPSGGEQNQQSADDSGGDEASSARQAEPSDVPPQKQPEKTTGDGEAGASPAAPEEQTPPADKARTGQAMPDGVEKDPQQQATEQWLRRIPDDPGGLLRRKFKYQYRNQPQSEEEQPW